MNILSGIRIIIYTSIKLTPHPSALTTKTFCVGRELHLLRPFLFSPLLITPFDDF